MYQNILVAIDGSETSFMALHEALRLARPSSQICAITVVENPLVSDPVEISAHSDRVIQDACMQEGRNILARAEKDAAHLGRIALQTQLIDRTSQVRIDIAHEILTCATERHADLIVIGTHGRRGVKRVILGSTAEEVIRQSPIPVLTIRYAAKAARHQAA